MHMNDKEVWPVMITPYTQTGSLDFNALGRLIEWYEANGVDGLFAVCQSSEMFYLSLRERIALARFVKNRAKIPVVASGHISYDLTDQIDEIRHIADTGVDAVVLVTNRISCDKENADVWMNNLNVILDKIDPSVSLGLYECPYPYKRLLSERELEYCANTGRFSFLKDTCCDLVTLKRRIQVVSGTKMKLYNANSSTLLSSIRAGADGFSGIMANFHPDLYVWLMKNYQQKEARAECVQAILTICSLIERQYYPVNAKYHLRSAGLPVTLYSRVLAQSGLTETYQDEIRQMEIVVQAIRKEIIGMST